MAAASDAVVAAIEAEATAGRAVVVGLSLGGYVAIEARRARARSGSRGLVLAGCSAEPVGPVGAAVPGLRRAPGAGRRAARSSASTRASSGSATAAGSPSRSSPAASGRPAAPRRSAALVGERFLARLAGSGPGPRSSTARSIRSSGRAATRGPPPAGAAATSSCRGRRTSPTSTARRRSPTLVRRFARTPPAAPDAPSTRLAAGPSTGVNGAAGILADHPPPAQRGSMRVRKAVFPAAGWGTRFLPATKAQPKEMLPLVDKPIIQYAVEEAVAAGHRAGHHRHLAARSGRSRTTSTSPTSSSTCSRRRATSRCSARSAHISDLAQVAYVRQKEQLGLGHAVLMAKDLIGHEPFAVILPDDVVVADRPCIGQLIHAYHQTHGVGRRGHGGPARGDRAATASSPPSRPRTRSTTAGCTGSRALVEKPAPERRAVEPRGHRPLRPDAQDLRQARADPARRRRRDPADRRDRRR